MSLQLYRRHTSKCSQHLHRHERIYESDERRRGFRKCSCPIHVEGTLDRFGRRGTQKTRWEEARAVAAGLEAAGSCDAILPAAVVNGPPAVLERPFGRSLDEGIHAFLADCRSRRLAPSTLRKYCTLTKQLRVYADAFGLVWLRQWTDVQTVAEFRASWKDGSGSGAKKLERLKSFFGFCVDRAWIEKNPAARLKAPAGSSRAANRSPYTDAELERMQAACDQIPAQKWSNGSAEGVWSGEEAKTLIMLLTYTGLRISDAVTFSMHRLRGNTLFLRQHKTGRPLSTYLPDILRDRLHALALRQGEYPFIGALSQRKETAADLWRRKLNKVFELCGKWEERPCPHRFRYTFARILLQNGVSAGDVAELMGDTEAVVLKFYSPWVSERQTRVTDTLRKAFSARDSVRA